jgi:hypothetical protein
MWHMCEFMLNWMTSHQVLKMAATLCYVRLNTILRVVLPFKCWPSPVGCCLSSLLWCEVPPPPSHTLAASGSGQEKICGYQLWQSKGPQVVWIDSVLQWSNDSRGENECHFEPPVEKTVNYSRTVLAWTGNATEARFICFRLYVQELEAKTFRAFYMNSNTRREDGRVKGTDRTEERIIAPQSDNSSSDSDHFSILNLIVT